MGAWLTSLGAAMFGRTAPSPHGGFGRRWEGWFVCLCYVAVSRVGDLGEGVASATVLGGREGALALLQAVGRALLPCLAAWVIVDWVSKRDDAGRLLAPLVTSALLYRGALGLGWVSNAARLSFDVAGLLGCVAGAWRVRAMTGARAAAREDSSDATTLREADEREAAPEVAAVGNSKTPMSRRAAWGIVGGGATLGALVVAGFDARRVAARWEQLGPLGRDSPVPPFRARTLAGARFDGSALSGAPTLLVFWATWCGYCLRQMPTIRALHEDLGPRGLRVVGVNVERARDREEKVRDYVREKGLAFTQVLDNGQLGDAFRVSLLPHVVLVDAEGIVRGVFQGKTSADVLRRASEKMLVGAAP